MSVRAVVFSLVLTPFNVLFLVHAAYTGTQFTGGESLLANAVATLFLLTLVNSLLRSRRPRWAFGRGELLTIYLLLEASTAVSCSVWDFGGSLTLGITYPFWFATPSNRWEALLWPHLPTWLTVRDPMALEGFYAGRANPYTAAILRAWAVPALWWTGVVTALLWVCLCLNSIVRRRWQEEEKLAFPLVAVPVQLVNEHTSPLRSRLFWLAAGIAAVLTLWNTVVRIYPSVPPIPMELEYGRYVQRPWTFIRFPYLSWKPWHIGLCYLIPPDLALSLFLFDLLWMGEFVLSGHLGWCMSPWRGFPYGYEQCAGGLLALLMLILWSDRNHLSQVFRRALGLPSVLRDDAQREALGYRTAVLGAIVGFALLWGFLARAGMKGWVIPVFLLLFFAISLAVSRFRAQIGPPEHALDGMMPDSILNTAFGPRALGGNTLGVFATMGTYIRGQGNNPSPIQLEALKMAEGGVLEKRRIALALMGVVPLAMLCYFWASLDVGYRIGMGTGEAGQGVLIPSKQFVYGAVTGLQNPTGSDTSGIVAMVVGGSVTTLMMLIKYRLPWWPLHPVAFPLALSFGTEYFTAALFATWLTKTLVLRYGGLRAYRASFPLFLGMLVGGATAGVLQCIVYGLLGIRAG